MMILVQVPEKTMHNKTVCKPGNSFHDDESAEYDEYEKKCIHYKKVRSNKKNITCINNKCMANLFRFSKGENLNNIISNKLIPNQHIQLYRGTSSFAHFQKPNFIATGSINQSNKTASVAPSEITDIAFKTGAGSAWVDDIGLIIFCNSAVILIPEQ